MTEATPPLVVRSVADVRSRISTWRQDAHSVALVPTMGALHAGHLDLIARMADRCSRVVVSIFVNPKQFDDDDDLAAYPRREAQDAAAAMQAGADLIYAPGVEDMYPPGFATRISVAGVTDDLEGAHRPGHFDGVTTVVAKLLLQVSPDAAIFGEKDYQQLQVIRRLAADLDLPTQIVAAPIVRETDGLALSSRNQHLTDPQRRIAGGLNRVLSDLVKRAAQGETLDRLEQDGRTQLLQMGFDGVDYLTFRHAHDLTPVRALRQPTRLLAVARLGGVRLLDNMPVPAQVA